MPRKRKPKQIRKRRRTNHADVWVLIDQRAQQIHLLVQIRPPDVSYPLPSKTLCAILATYGVLLQLSTMSETHTRLVAIQTRPSTETSCRT